jgi:hypothetical protein
VVFHDLTKLTRAWPKLILGLLVRLYAAASHRRLVMPGNATAAWTGRKFEGDVGRSEGEV